MAKLGCECGGYMINTTVESAAGRSVRRVLEVLELFAELRTPLAIKQIAYRLGYPLSSTNVLVRELCALGYLSYDRKLRLYFPTLQVATVGDWIENALIGKASLEDFCLTLQRATGETVAVSMQNDAQMQIVRIAHSEQALRLNLEGGQRVSLIRTGIGRALLSTMATHEARRLVQRVLRLKPDEAQGADEDSVVESLKQIRRCGFIAAYDMLLDGVGAIAMPLPETISSTRLVVAVGGPSARVKRAESETVRIMRTTIEDFFPDTALAHGKTAQRRE